VCVAGAAINVEAAGTRLGENALAPSLSKKIFGESRSGDDSCAKLLHRAPVAEEVCRTNTDKPAVLFVGDSHAMALYSAVLARAVSVPAAIVAGHSCQLYPTLNNTAPRRKGWGNNCAAIAREVLELVRAVPSIQSVVIANMAVDASPDNESKWQQGSARLSEREAFVRGNSALIGGLLAQSRRVIFLTDLPTFAHTPNECVPRLPIHVPADCVIQRASFDQDRLEYNQAIAALANANPAAVFVDPTALFCDARFCHQRDDRSFLYEDRHHLSVYGSRKLIETYLRGPLGLSEVSGR
jgi:hypothetical protein